MSFLVSSSNFLNALGIVLFGSHFHDALLCHTVKGLLSSFTQQLLLTAIAVQ